MMQFDLNEHEAAAMLLLLIIARDTYSGLDAVGARDARDALDRIPPGHIETLFDKIEAVVAAQAGVEGVA